MNKLGSSSMEEEFRLTISRKSRKHEAVKALFWRGGDFDTENGGRCCRRSFVGSTFGPFTWPLLAESFVIDVPPLHYHFLHDHVFWITRNLSDDSQVERISKDPSASIENEIEDWDHRSGWAHRSPVASIELIEEEMQVCCLFLRVFFFFRIARSDCFNPVSNKVRREPITRA